MPQALLDNDILILEEQEDQRNCESRFHGTGKYGHRDGTLHWVLFFCRCHKFGVTVRCQAWLDGVPRREAWDCAECGQDQVKTSEWFSVIGPVE